MSDLDSFFGAGTEEQLREDAHEAPSVNMWRAPSPVSIASLALANVMVKDSDISAALNIDLSIKPNGKLVVSSREATKEQLALAKKRLESYQDFMRLAAFFLFTANLALEGKFDKA